jgi:hypothetical protein
VVGGCDDERKGGGEIRETSEVLAVREEKRMRAAYLRLPKDNALWLCSCLTAP